MGYACPVCGTEEVDAVHLANHLAVTASLGREDHGEWLRTHAPDWHERGPEELADVVVDYAPEVETPEFESGEGAAPSLEAALETRARRPGRGSMAGGSVPDDVLREARELTEAMERDRGEGADAGGEDDAEGGATDAGDGVDATSENDTESQ